MLDFLRAQRCCDLVMKGGITSGILYPPAICRIAEAFHLVGIGGTSAGAMAACAAAAAEYRRRKGDETGYQLLEGLPQELTGEGRLEGLFRPDGSTRELHRLMMDGLASKGAGWLRRKLFAGRVGWTLLRRESKLQPLVENGFGICTGMANGNRPGPREIAPLTEWLADKIDQIAGNRGPNPLTFGDLRHAPIPPHLEDTLAGREDRSIDLRTVTTCLSFGRPYELPFAEEIFAFDPDEWRRLFPERVMAYLLDASKPIDAPSLRRDGKLPLPSGDRMPVIVAARMSLSFPGLFTMVPLHAVNYHQPDEPMWRVWFSDGGITSNLPIHRFDGLFPRWPTLGINLQYTDETGRPGRRSVDESLVYLIKRRADGARDLWNVFDDRGSGVQDVIGFGGAIFRSAQVWHDNAFLRLPSYRDRVAEIWLRKKEGGLNLNMPAEVIRELTERGNRAGIALRERFAEAPPQESLSWNGHRWARLRSGLGGLANYLEAFKRNVEHPMAGDPSLADLLSRRDAAPAYPFSADQFETARKAIEGLLAYLSQAESISRGAGAPDLPFRGGPEPIVEIGSRAPI
jgi:predicted acylesterase/phospholipase RssA